MWQRWLPVYWAAQMACMVSRLPALPAVVAVVNPMNEAASSP
jgi:hypothetical protein